MIMIAAPESSEAFQSVQSNNGVTGWVQKGLPEGLFSEFIRDPGRFLDVPSPQVLKSERKVRVIRQTLIDHEGMPREVVIKQFHYSSLRRRVGSFLTPSSAARCVRGALLLKQYGFGTANPLAVFEYRTWRNWGISYYITDEIKESFTLPAFWRDVLPTLSRKQALRKRREVLGEVARLCYRLHSLGIYHGDFKGSNILIRPGDDGEWQCFLVDVDRIRKSRRLRWSKRVKNLVQLYRTLGRRMSIRDKIFFLKRYSEFSCLLRKDRKNLARKVLALSTE
ncbi:MAG: lipopolysaccharide kinase InaA family protein [Candidatus Binatia bacterium]